MTDLGDGILGAEALGKQDRFVNQGVATFALNHLWRLMREGSIDHHGYFVNMAQGRVVPMPIDPASWKRIKKIKVRPERPTKKITTSTKKTLQTLRSSVRTARQRPSRNTDIIAICQSEDDAQTIADALNLFCAEPCTVPLLLDKTDAIIVADFLRHQSTLSARNNTPNDAALRLRVVEQITAKLSAAAPD